MSSSDNRSRPLLIALVVLGVLHWVLVSASVGLRPEHVAVDLALIILAAAGHRYPRIGNSALVLMPFWLTGVVYEATVLLLPFRGPVHVADLHQMELSLFGVTQGNVEVPLSTYLQEHTLVFLDVICGAAYIGYVILPIGLVLGWVWRRVPHRAVRLAWAFLLVNVMGFSIQLLWPAAPAWYITDYGLGPAIMDAAPSSAGAARFDTALGITYFAGFYARNVNVFGAMPSLHVSYPALATLALIPLGLRHFIPALLFTILVGFSALYLNHHYVLDLILGVLCAAVAFGTVAAIQKRFFPQAKELSR